MTPRSWCSTRHGWRSTSVGPVQPIWSPCASEWRPDIPLIYVPYLFTRSHGIRTTRQIADRLAEELL